MLNILIWTFGVTNFAICGAQPQFPSQQQFGGQQFQPLQQSCRRTPPTTEGPYYRPNAPYTPGTACEADAGYNRIILTGRVVDVDSQCQQGIPSVLDVWQADYDGDYHGITNLWGGPEEVPPTMQKKSRSLNCRARFETDQQGNFRIVTTMPGRHFNYVSRQPYYRPAHIYFKIRPQTSGYQELTTQLYFEGDKYLNSRTDVSECPTCNANDSTLYIRLQHVQDIKTYVGQFNIAIQRGASGTVPDDMQRRSSYLNSRPRTVDLPFGSVRERMPQQAMGGFGPQASQFGMLDPQSPFGSGGFGQQGQFGQGGSNFGTNQQFGWQQPGFSQQQSFYGQPSNSAFNQQGVSGAFGSNQGQSGLGFNPNQNFQNPAWGQQQQPFFDQSQQFVGQGQQRQVRPYEGGANPEAQQSRPYDRNQPQQFQPRPPADFGRK